MNREKEPCVSDAFEFARSTPVLGAALLLRLLRVHLHFVMRRGCLGLLLLRAHNVFAVFRCTVISSIYKNGTQNVPPRARSCEHSVFRRCHMAQ